MDFLQFFANPKKLDINNLRNFFKSYNLNSDLIGIDYEEGKVDSYLFTFHENETYGFEQYPCNEMHLIFDEFLDEDEIDSDGYGKEGRELQRKLFEKNIHEDEMVYRMYFKLSKGGQTIDCNNNVVNLSSNDVALYTYVYALYLSKYHKGVLFYANASIYVTDEVLEELIQKGLRKQIMAGGRYIIDKDSFTSQEKYYKMLADKGDDIAQVQLGYLYEQNYNVEEALKYYKMSADNGNIVGQFNTGVVYQNNKDLKNAEKYYKMAADRGKTSAKFNLAYIYEETNRINEAIKYYKMAAEDGYVDAQFNLALLYEENNDKENAIKYYKMAAENGDLRADQKLKNS